MNMYKNVNDLDKIDAYFKVRRAKQIYKKR